METIQNNIKDTSPSWECILASSTPGTTLAMSLIFERVLDAYKLNGFQQNFEHSFLRVYLIQNISFNLSKTEADLRLS